MKLSHKVGIVGTGLGLLAVPLLSPRDAEVVPVDSAVNSHNSTKFLDRNRASEIPAWESSPEYLIAKSQFNPAYVKKQFEDYYRLHKLGLIEAIDFGQESLVSNYKLDRARGAESLAIDLEIDLKKLTSSEGRMFVSASYRILILQEQSASTALSAMDTVTWSGFMESLASLPADVQKKLGDRYNQLLETAERKVANNFEALRTELSSILPANRKIDISALDPEKLPPHKEFISTIQSVIELGEQQGEDPVAYLQQFLKGYE